MVKTPKVKGRCWLWPKSQKGKGYGAMWYAGHSVMVHKHTYEREYGIVPIGFELDHLCRVRLCFNPDHLEVVTHAENVRRGNAGGMHQKQKTKCKQGHSYTVKNTYIRPDGNRGCYLCRQVQNRHTVQRRKQKEGTI